ncbi:4-phosphoerythronate dehydrogenase PdxB [Parabacteroides sp. PF5-9]|uniref:4-phosphoerythronate dehydrogenase PdxB n=1 Tax=Parabacteroides sp. PF5-9 TaxID=1742404 RepID=UPI0024747104|nr:4-phosphoerythronate dehydrogenase PdxB [Parabacteroides sp. PF5-9]MDH6358224.1 erythronate-4-phosphate dehydrogenase [Parabacteroides sp. PF5-9]
MKIIADKTIPYLKGIPESFAEINYISSGGFTADTVKNADVLIVRSIDKCTREILEGSRVKLITTATIGYDHIDTDYCNNAGITWRNAPGCNALSVAQYVLASLVTFSLRKKISLKGKTLGIVGVGHVGKEVERLCRAFGMQILKNDPPREKLEGEKDFVSLDVIARESDIITFHTPLTTDGPYPTFHLIDEPFLNKLKKKPWIINSCRGRVHNTSALLNGLASQKIGALILDCWENEPFIDHELLNKTAIATPHIAGFSADGKANATRMCLEEIETFFHMQINRIHEVTPSPPVNPVINLNHFQEHRIEEAILYSFNPLPVDKALREKPENFESFRTDYNHPREFAAYQVVNATQEERHLLVQLGFTCLD